LRGGISQLKSWGLAAPRLLREWVPHSKSGDWTAPKKIREGIPHLKSWDWTAPKIFKDKGRHPSFKILGLDGKNPKNQKTKKHMKTHEDP